MLFLGIGILRLAKRMRTLSDNADWQLRYMSSPFILYPVVTIFLGINMLMIVITAMSRRPGTIPRYYWVVTFFACVAAGALYWCGLKVLQLDFGSGTTLGKRIGFEVNVWNEGDEDIPDNLRDIMEDAVIDGSRRRVTYKVSGPTLKLRDWWRRIMRWDLVR